MDLAKNCDQLVGGYTCVCASVHVYGVGEVPPPIFNFWNETSFLGTRPRVQN